MQRSIRAFAAAAVLLHAGASNAQRPPFVLPFPVVPVADSFLAAKEALFPHDHSLRLDRKTVAKHCVWCLRTDSLGQWQRCLATIRASLADDPELVNWFDVTLAEFPPSVSGRSSTRRHSGASAPAHARPLGRAPAEG